MNSTSLYSIIEYIDDAKITATRGTTDIYRVVTLCVFPIEKSWFNWQKLLLDFFYI